jgi:hypothetical protein
VVLSLLDVTALTTLSQRWNTLSLLAGVVVVENVEVGAALAVCYLPLVML